MDPDSSRSQTSINRLPPYYTSSDFDLPTSPSTNKRKSDRKSGFFPCFKLFSRERRQKWTQKSWKSGSGSRHRHLRSRGEKIPAWKDNMASFGGTSPVGEEMQNYVRRVDKKSMYDDLTGDQYEGPNFDNSHMEGSSNNMPISPSKKFTGKRSRNGTAPSSPKKKKMITIRPMIEALRGRGRGGKSKKRSPRGGKRSASQMEAFGDDDKLYSSASPRLGKSAVVQRSRGGGQGRRTKSRGLRSRTLSFGRKRGSKSKRELNSAASPPNSMMARQGKTPSNAEAERSPSRPRSKKSTRSASNSRKKSANFGSPTNRSSPRRVNSSSSPLNKSRANQQSRFGKSANGSPNVRATRPSLRERDSEQRVAPSQTFVPSARASSRKGASEAPLGSPRALRSQKSSSFVHQQQPRSQFPSSEAPLGARRRSASNSHQRSSTSYNPAVKREGGAGSSATGILGDPRMGRGGGLKRKTSGGLI